MFSLIAFVLYIVSFPSCIGLLVFTVYVSFPNKLLLQYRYSPCFGVSLLIVASSSPCFDIISIFPFSPNIFKNSASCMKIALSYACDSYVSS